MQPGVKQESVVVSVPSFHPSIHPSFLIFFLHPFKLPSFISSCCPLNLFFYSFIPPFFLLVMLCVFYFFLLPFFLSGSTPCPHSTRKLKSPNYSYITYHWLFVFFCMQANCWLSLSGLKNLEYQIFKSGSCLNSFFTFQVMWDEKFKEYGELASLFGFRNSSLPSSTRYMGKMHFIICMHYLCFVL